jgi:diaminopimelate epimerase
MIEIPFTKLHGAGNDFLLTWRDEAPEAGLAEIAQRICTRTTGVGADGWMLVWLQDVGLATQLFNSDGGEAELSGNGTRCAAAFGLLNGVASPPQISVVTGAGKKDLQLLWQRRNEFLFEMDMGLPKVEDLYTTIQLAGSDFDATILNVGNPQCAIFVEEFPENWRVAAQQAERYQRFPQHSNVSFVRVLDRHTIEALFFERGVGETRSSGTGSTGAATAAILRKIVESPVEIRTPAGNLSMRWDKTIYLTGPAERIAEGRVFLDL